MAKPLAVKFNFVFPMKGSCSTGPRAAWFGCKLSAWQKQNTQGALEVLADLPFCRAVVLLITERPWAEGTSRIMSL